MLASGTGKGIDGSVITNATPFEWVWKLVLDKFSGAPLDFDDLLSLFHFFVLIADT